MAENENLDDDDLDLATEGDKKNILASLLDKKTLLMIGGGVLLIALSIGGTLMLSGGNSGDGAEMADEDEEVVADKKSDKKKKKKGKGEKEPVYFSMVPAFVANFTDKTGVRYLQTSIDILVTDALVIDDIKKHNPLIRNNLLLLIGSQTTDVITTREGKQRLRNDILKEIQKIMKEKTGEPGVEAVYFTSFVVQ